jgi:hypothetical protein
VNDTREMQFSLKADELSAHVEPLPKAEARIAHWQREFQKRRAAPLDETR